MAEHGIPVEVNPDRRLDVRRHRGRDGTATDTVQAAACSNQSDQRVGPASQQAWSIRERSGKHPLGASLLAARKQTPNSESGRGQEAGIGAHPKPPAANSNTFPIPPLLHPDKRSQAANTAIDSLNMLFIGPSHTSCEPNNQQSDTAAQKVSLAVRERIAHMTHTEQKQIHFESAAMIAEAALIHRTTGAKRILRQTRTGSAKRSLLPHTSQVNRPTAYQRHS